MNLESQVCALEYAKRLKELNVKQESLFYWSKLSIQTEYKLELRTNIFTQQIILADCTDYISAFTVAELGEMLPYKLEPDIYYYSTGKSSKDDKYYAEHEVSYVFDDGCLYLTRDKNEANARAKMLIYLIENGLVKV